MNRSAGLLMFRRGATGPEVFLVHPGGPFFAKKDLGVWTIPKGAIEEGEEELDAAQREFREETGWESAGPFLYLGRVRQRSDKQVICWAFEAPEALDTSLIRSNRFTMEWPPGSGRFADYPEIDRGEFFPLREARLKLLPAQGLFLDRLVGSL